MRPIIGKTLPSDRLSSSSRPSRTCDRLRHINFSNAGFRTTIKHVRTVGNEIVVINVSVSISKLLHVVLRTFKYREKKAAVSVKHVFSKYDDADNERRYRGNQDGSRRDILNPPGQRLPFQCN